MSVKRAAAFRGGTSPLMQVARAPVVALMLAKHAPVFVILCAPPAIWAVAEGQAILALALAIPATFAALVFLAVARRPLPDDLRGVEAIVTIALVFGMSAVFVTPAFMALGMPVVDALFEAVSGATTTGLSVAFNPDAWPFAGHFLRAWVQWCGGLVMATAVLAMLLPSGLPARKLGQAGIDQGDRIASTRKQARQLLTAYAALTGIMTLATMATIPDWREALAVTLSAVSTAGFAPRSDSLASYAPLAQGMVMLSCVLGAVSLLSFVLLSQGKWRQAWRLGSLRRVGLTVILFVAALIAFLVAAGERDAGAIYSSALNLISGLTTAGFSTGPISDLGPVLLLIVVAMVLGGDVGSTAGGLKLARVAVIVGAILHAGQRLRLPRNAVAPLRQNGEPVAPETLVSILGLLGIYLGALMLLWLHILAHGHDALGALFEATSTLSTVGLSTGITGPSMSVDLKLSMTFAMWLGRVEFFAVLLLLAPRTWRGTTGG
ncbi:potassium uptake system protein TrkH (plasmid) [Dinoroseobacter shibae DFL 12 = DSM 16493]|jgi:trk system potassium uptake protein TrkH|uniref:Potassium uptake system protein TrkH n=2 Tax=Dinoroseobacter shibae TaxID=215813 RepID=A8LTS5_DINSH|nr:potassium uptake system protein TrkH [Dinoroseobacter shibae DFL 12 = DSM 16493]